MSFTESLEELVARNENGLLSVHSSWARVPLGEVATILNGFAFSSTEFSQTHGKPLLRIRDVLGIETQAFYTGQFDDLYLVQPGELLVGMDGDFNCALWKGPEAVLNQRVCKISPNEQFYGKHFLVYSLPAYLRAINGATSSVTVKHLSSRTVQEIPLPLPPRSEQDRIIAEIEKQFTRLDAAVAALKRVQANLKRYRAAVLKAACEGRLVPTEAELARKSGRRYETGEQLLAHILKERRAKWEVDQLARMQASGKRHQNDDWKKKYIEPEPLSTSDLPSLPEGWIWVRAEQICEFITKGTTPSAAKLFDATGDVPFIKVYNLTNRGVLDFSVKPTFVEKSTHAGELARSRVMPGDVLMNIVGPPLGKVSIVPDSFPEWNINQAIAIFRPISGLDRRYLAALLLCDDILRWAIRRARATAGQFNLTLEICRDLPLPLPPLSEQIKIVETMDVSLTTAESAERTFEFDIQRADRLRQSILKRAFEGKLAPQDPHDEPASVLLERIRAERALAVPKPKGRSFRPILPMQTVCGK